MKLFFRLSAACLVALLFCASAIPAFAADAAAKAVQKRYASIQTMRSSFTQTLLHKESGGKEERTGMLYFAKPLNVRWETKTPAPELLVVTDAIIWNVFPDEGVAYMYAPKLVEDSRNIMRVITGQSPLDKDFFIENKGKDGGLIKLLLIPKEPTQALVEATIWVDGVSGFIKRALIVDFYYNQNDILFTEQRIDETFPSTVFSYKPPASMKVEDRTTGGSAKKPLMR